MADQARTEKPPRARVLEWLDERIGLEPLIELARHKEVPRHRHSIWYYFGGMTLFLFMVQVVTGILLLLYYRPTAEAAFESVRFIMTEVKFGWLIRSIHSWSANLMIAAAFVHMFSVFLMRAYRKPREITWVTGAFLLFLSLGFGFSGYLLPWNQLAYFATKVGTEIPGVFPVVGDFIVKMLRGGEDVTGATLTRFFGFHVAVLPFVTTALLGIHLYLVQRHGMSIPPDVESEEDRGKKVVNVPFIPDFLLRDILGWVVALGLLVLLASVFPWELGEKADPLGVPDANIRPEWFFVFMFQTLKYIPSKIFFLEGEFLGVLAFTIGGLLLVIVPFIDRRRGRGEHNRIFFACGVIAIFYIAALTMLGYASSFWPAGWPPALATVVVPAVVLLIMFYLWMLYDSATAEYPEERDRWPRFLFVLVLGPVGALIHLLTRTRRRSEAAAGRASRQSGGVSGRGNG